MKKILLLLFALLVSLASNAQQDGDLITPFTPPSYMEYVTAITRDNINGGIYIAGYELAPGSGGDWKVYKLKSDGTIDGSFAVPSGLLNNIFDIEALFVDSNNNLLIGCTEYQNSIIMPRIYRLSSTGIQDTGFTTNFQNQFFIRSIAQQTTAAGSRIIVGGFAYAGVGAALYGINNTNGQIDTGFNSGGAGPTTQNNGTRFINSVSVNPNNNQILIGGVFSHYNGSASQNAALLNANGTLSQSFSFPNDSSIQATAIQPNGSLLLGGFFQLSGKIGLVRFNGSSLDTSFTADFNSVNSDVSTIEVQCDGNIIIGGNFTTLNGLSRNNVARLLGTTGAVDTNFNPGLGTDDYVQESVLGAAGELYICGNFTTYNSTPRNRIAKIKASPLLIANPDSGTISTAGGTAITNVLANDTVNNNPATTSNVALSFVSSTHPNITLGTNGQVNVAANTPAGTYYLIYRICQFGTTGCYCKEGIATITVVGTGTINAVDDTWTINNKACSPTLYLLTNDTVLGTGATISNVTISGTENYPYLTFSPATGTVSISPSISAGTYTFTYQICSIATPSLCDTATVTITIVNAPVVIAMSDIGLFTTVAGTAASFPLIAVLGNDTVGGQPATTQNVSISFGSSNPDITYNATTGMVTISGNVPPGNYGFFYQICDLVTCRCNSGSGTASIIVLGELEANDDNFTSSCINGVTGGSSIDVTANDTMGTDPLDDNLVTISLINDGGLQGVTISPAGIINIPANSPFGIYVLDYSICYNDVSVCDNATVNICINNGLNPGTGANNTVYAVEVQQDGYIIIGGAFTKYNNIPRNRIARLKSDLSLDETFDPGAIGFNNVVQAVALQGNKIIVGGAFTATSQGTPVKCLARLNSNGSLDTTFASSNFQMGPQMQDIPRVMCLGFQSNGMIIAGGTFHIINNSSGFTKTNLARFSANGTPDNTFTSALTKYMGIVRDIYVMTDNSIVAGGMYLRIGSSLNMLYKVNANGAVDTGFNMAQQVLNETGVYAIERTSSKLLVGGNFRFYDAIGPQDIAQISSTGAIDPTSLFNPQLSSDSAIASIALNSSNNSIYIGGSFVTYNNNNSIRIARLNSNGSFDSSFNTGTGFTNNPSGGSVYALKLYTDNNILKLLTGGTFTAYNGNQAKYITRLDTTTTPVVQGRLIAPGEDSQTVTLYPNPSNGIFNIDLKGYDENTTFDVTVYNPLGQLIYKGSITAQGSNAIDLTGHETGNYFITLQNNLETINRVVTVKK